MPLNLKMVAAPALIWGAIVKACILSDGNAAILVLSSIIFLMTGIDIYHTVNDNNKKQPSFFTILASVVAIEVLLYDLSIAIQLILLPLGAAYLMYSDVLLKYVVAWALLRVVILTATAPEGSQLLWRVSQLVLLIGLAAAYLMPYNRNAERAITVTICVITAILLFNGKDTLPHKLPVWLIIIPVSYLVGAVMSDKTNRIETFIVFAIICVCFIYPFSDEQTSQIQSGPCAQFSNTIPCSDVSTTFQLRISNDCCCDHGFIMMENMCIIEECKSNLLSNPKRDCCKIMRNAVSDNFLHGPYQCLCNNKPGEGYIHKFDFIDKKCICAPPNFGEYCEFK